MPQLIHNPNTLFTQTKEWIASGQAEVLSWHDERAESGQTPLSVLVEDIKQDPQKHIQRLKQVLATTVVVAAGMSSFNPNALAQSQSPFRVETNANQVQINSEKTVVTKAEQKLVKQFANQVFEPQGGYSSMNRGGTPNSIRNILDKGESITRDNAPQIIMEAIKINNGATNPINLKHYKAQIKMFNYHLQQGYTPSEALFKSVADCAKANPTEIKAPSIDLERLSSTSKQIREDCVDAKVDTIGGLNEATRIQTKNELKKSNLTPLELNKVILNLKDSKSLIVKSSPTTKNNTTPQESQNKQTTTKTNKNQINGPFNNPNNPTTPVIEKQKPQNPTKSGYEWFNNINRQAIEDTLKQLGILLVVGGATTVAGIKASKVLYGQFQEFRAALPVSLSEDEIRRIFWENIDKIKSDYRKKKVFEAKLKGFVVDREINKASINVQNQNDSVKANELSQNQIQEFENVFGSNQVANTTELKPRVGERWSSYIRGFREAITNAISFVKSKGKESIGVQLQKANNIKEKVQSTFEQKQKAKTDNLRAGRIKEGNLSKSIFHLRNEYDNALLKTKDWFELNRDDAEREYDREFVREQEPKRLKETRAELKAKMDKFEIPFIPQEVETSKPEAIITTENMREFSNFDIEAALILSGKNLENIRKESKYVEQAQKAADFINKELAKHNQNAIFNKIQSEYSLPERFNKLGIFWNRGPSKFGIGEKKEKEIYHRAKKNQEPYTSIQVIYERADYTFEYYLNILQGLKNHFKNNKNMQNALDVLVAFANEQDKVVQTESKMRQELVRRRSGRFSRIENRGGKCEQFDMHSHITYLVNVYSTKTYYYSYNRPMDKEEFKEKASELLYDLSLAVCEKNPLDGKWFKTTNDKINIDRVEEILNALKDLVKLHKIPNGDVEYEQRGKSELFDMGTLDHLLWFCKEIKRQLKLPANHLAFLENEYEFDVIPPNSSKDPYLKQFVLDGTSWPQQLIPNPLRIVKIDGQRGIKYPTSLVFPEVLEIKAMRQHLGSLLSELKVSNKDIQAMINAHKNPNGCTEYEAHKLKWFTDILAKPDYAYRPYRKPKTDSDSPVPQKPISLVELLLSSSNLEDDENI